MRSSDNLKVYFFLAFRGLSQFHNHAQYVEAVCLASHTAIKHCGFVNEAKHCLKCVIIDIFQLYFEKHFSTEPYDPSC